MFNPIKEESEGSFSNRIPSILDRIQEKIDYEAFLATKKPLKNNSNQRNKQKLSDFYQRNSEFLTKKAQKLQLQKTQLTEQQPKPTFQPMTTKYTPKPPTKPHYTIIYKDKPHIF